MATTPSPFSANSTTIPTDLVYYGLRYYNPSTGRWLSKDPSDESGGLNLYGFVENDSVNFMDSSGRVPIGPAFDLAWTIARATVIAHVERYIGGSIDASILSAAIVDHWTESGKVEPFKTKPLWGELTDDSLTHIVRDAIIGKLIKKGAGKIKERFPNVPEEKLQKALEKGYDVAKEAMASEAAVAYEWSIFPRCDSELRQLHVLINAESRITISGDSQSVWTLGLYSADFPFDSFASRSAAGGIKLGDICGCGR
jgi:RHS repeat-associated protein